MECLEISKQYEAEAEEKPELHPLMRALDVDNTDDYLFVVLSRIRASDLEEALLLLPFSSVCEVLERLPRLVERHNDELELLCKVTIFLFKVHMKPITGAKSLKPLLTRLVAVLQSDVDGLRDPDHGMNVHALALLQHDVEEREGVELFHEATQERKKREKKRREATKRRLAIQIT